MEFISGADRQQMILLPDCVDDYIGEENAVRVIDAYVNSLDLQALGFSRPKPRDTGRPIYNPKDLLKLYIYGYMNRVRSSRRLETETKRNLEVVWLLGKLSPDHKTIATFRHDNTAALKNVFRDFVRLCVKLGLYGRELIAIDGSKFKAVNAQDRNFCEKKLQYRIARIEARIEEYLLELEDSDSEDVAAEGEKSSEEIAGIIVALEQRKERYQGYIQELAQTGESQKSLTDPDSRRMLSNGKMDICYNVQTAVDSAHKLVAEFEVTNDAFDINKITPMVERTKETLQAQQFSAVMDAGYDSVQDIVASMSQGIDVHVAGVDFDICIPAEEPSNAEITAHKDGRCVYFADRNLTLCPMGKVLQPRFYKRNRYGGFGVFFNYGVCKQCTCKCTKEARGRRYQVLMPQSSFSKAYNDDNLHIRQTRIAPDSKRIQQRKCIVEHPFGTVKRSMDAGYCLTRGLQNVSGEFSLASLAYKFKRVINILGAQKLIECIAA